MISRPDSNSAAKRRVISCELVFDVTERAQFVLQIVAADSAGEVLEERLDVEVSGNPSPKVAELRNAEGERMHVFESDAGRLHVSYRSVITAALPRSPGSEGVIASGSSTALQTQVYLRPSRYVPSDHLVGFAQSEFGSGEQVATRIATINDWIRRRISYVPGSSDVHDSAEHTLLTGMGTCRDFAHLGIALCRATGIPARFAAVYAPGLSPMEFHAVFEAFESGRWYVHDATGLAPRPSLVRIATGRDAADTAFCSVNGGAANLEDYSVTATVGSDLPEDDHSKLLELA